MVGAATAREAINTDIIPDVSDTQAPPATGDIPNRAQLRALWNYFRPARAALIWAALATAAAAATEPLIPYLMQILLDDGFARQAIALAAVPAVLIGVFVLRGCAMFVAQYALAHAANGALMRLRQAMFGHLMVSRLEWLTKQSASSLSNTLVYEIQQGTNLLIQASLTLIKDSLTLVALVAYLLYLNPLLTGLVLLIFPLLVGVMRALSRRLFHLTRSAQSATDALAYVVEENTLAHRSVRLHGAQQQQIDRFDGLSQRLRRLGMKSTIASAAMRPITQILASFALSAVLVVALMQSQQQQVSVGSFVSFVTAMLLLVNPIKNLADVATPITRGLAALDRGRRLLDTAPESSGGTHRVARAQGHLCWHNVSLHYPGATRAALRQVGLEVQAGEVVALVGPSGAGKTSMVHLLPRFLAPTQGTITLDGVALADWDVLALRQQMALVAQDVVMFNDTVAANVALGHAPDLARVRQALQDANLGDWLHGLPEGLHSVVGHNASELSGGQRQRLAIARAIYRDAPILILDEATSALDNASERLVQEALQRLMRGRTVLIIAHRLSTVEHADRVVVMAEGQIVEQGTHHALLAQGGLYAQLHRLGQHT